MINRNYLNEKRGLTYGNFYLFCNCYGNNPLKSGIIMKQTNPKLLEELILPLWDFTTFREVLSGVIKAPETLENTPIYPCEGVIGCYRTLPHFYGLTDAREGKIKGKTQGTTREWSGKENCRDVCQAPPEPPLCEAGQLNIAALVSLWIDGP